MHKLSVFLLMLIAVMGACKKSGSDSNIPGFDGKTCKILTMSTTQTGYSSSAWFYYNSSGNLLYTRSTSSLLPGDTSVGMQYKYQGGILQYSFFSNSINFSDTVFYFFNGTGRLQSTTEHNRAGSTLLSTKTDYFYNSSGKVIYTLARQTIDTVFVKNDSILYSYTGNNVTKFKQFEKTGYGTWLTLTIDISYDNMKNYNKAMGMPADSYFYWSENNITQMKFADSTNAFRTINISKYNESGYPTELTEIDNPLQQGPFTVVMTYQCK